ncbi:tRNA (adenosine(37)-N6)-threonylcarbamoyltransferase complex dimerization subunit type 1 TsaB [Saccharobesus litoralis]|uniref:tRNA threonylcarbamoyladenosine biosynthesis protein TsaB n=1 Tax=Saccharobesus litoralis TaxID=2172099 RepID=A0A2S0VUG0_9ALTE|nr:tRNA (adenosine(37)-N6)-threonylcarbamoyltransferase complex dimerization subunit type 1 TsaB [Saccharobesus litoralis]AWB67857.1 tRNA (adenosine(37)-N6)-threonylcarbamoyltransferase complex dimerization subunit type 1 TsaB [Saccharobesus litoralis]
MSKILAIDTSTEACSVALVDGQNVLANRYEVCPREHNKKVLVMTQQVLDEAQVSLDAVDFIAYGAGPGSFTGVRITAGIVQGLAFGAKKPVIGVSSLAAMAHQMYRLHNAKNVIAAIDARMSEIYLGVYRVKSLGLVEPIEDEKVTPPEGGLSHFNQSDEWHGTGTGWQTYRDELTCQVKVVVDDETLFPNAIDIALLALEKANKGQQQSAEHVVPTYLRNDVAWKKMPGRE